MADIVMAYAASHAPMMAADRESAPREQEKAEERVQVQMRSRESSG